MCVTSGRPCHWLSQTLSASGLSLFSTQENNEAQTSPSAQAWSCWETPASQNTTVCLQNTRLQTRHKPPSTALQVNICRRREQTCRLESKPNVLYDCCYTPCATWHQTDLRWSKSDRKDMISTETHAGIRASEHVSVRLQHRCRLTLITIWASLRIHYWDPR